MDKYKEMHEDLNELLCKFAEIPELIGNIKRDKIAYLVDKSDSYKLGYITAEVRALCGEIFVAMELFTDKYDEKDFLINDYVYKCIE